MTIHFTLYLRYSSGVMNSVVASKPPGGGEWVFRGWTSSFAMSVYVGYPFMSTTSDICLSMHMQSLMMTGCYRKPEGRGPEGSVDCERGSFRNGCRLVVWAAYEEAPSRQTCTRV